MKSTISSVSFGFGPGRIRLRWDALCSGPQAFSRAGRYYASGRDLAAEMKVDPATIAKTFMEYNEIAAKMAETGGEGRTKRPREPINVWRSFRSVLFRADVLVEAGLTTRTAAASRTTSGGRSPND